jgi:hypothetical protein
VGRELIEVPPQRVPAANWPYRCAFVGGRFSDRTPALEVGGEAGVLRFPGSDRVRPKQQAQRRILAFDRRDHRLRRLGRIAGLLAVAAIEVGFEGLNSRAVSVKTAFRPHVNWTCKFSPECAGLDNGHANAEWLHFVPQRLAPAFQREFRRAVRAEPTDRK